MELKRFLTFALFLNVLAPVCLEFIDPKKIYFNFDQDYENDNAEEEAASGNNENKKTNPEPDACKDCVPLEKYRSCLTDKKLFCDQFLVFLKMVDSLADQDATRQVLTFDLTLARSDLFSIKNAFRSKNCPDEISYLLTKFENHYSWKMRLMDNVGEFIVEHQTVISVISVSVFVFLLLIYWIYMSRSWISGALKLFVLIFIFSVFGTFVRKYQEHIAHNKATLHNGIPSSCQLGELGYLDKVWYLIKSQFSVMPDDCIKYYEAVTIDPMWKTSIVEAFSETLSRLILTPLPILFEYISKAILKLFQTLPTYLSVPVVVTVTVIIVVNMFLSRGYRLRTLLFSIEPTYPRPLTSSAQQNQAISSPVQNSLTNTTTPSVTSSQSPVRNQIEDIPTSAFKHEQHIQNSDANVLSVTYDNVPKTTNRKNVTAVPEGSFPSKIHNKELSHPASKEKLCEHCEKGDCPSYASQQNGKEEQTDSTSAKTSPPEPVRKSNKAHLTSCVQTQECHDNCVGDVICLTCSQTAAKVKTLVSDSSCA